MAEIISTGMNAPDPWPSAETLRENGLRFERERRARDLEQIKLRFEIPAEFEQLALEIWYDGKCD